jgi:hypothetical protein
MSWVEAGDTGRMHTPSTPTTDTTAALRAAIGPGLQFAGVTENLLRQASLTGQPSRRELT